MHDLQEEFAKWLSNETWRWTTYATLTFERPLRKDALRFARAWVRFIARTATEVWGFCFQETHWDGQRLHVHCLLSVRPNLIGQPSRKEMWSWWYQKFGRCQVQAYRPWTPNQKIDHHTIAALHIPRLASYVSKYVVKETSHAGFDWDFYAYSCGKELTSDEFKKYLGVNPVFLAGD